jgi:hypothetical protein
MPSHKRTAASMAQAKAIPVINMGVTGFEVELSAVEPREKSCGNGAIIKGESSEKISSCPRKVSVKKRVGGGSRNDLSGRSEPREACDTR